MRELEKLRERAPDWGNALERLIVQVSEHLLTQRIGGTVGRADVSLNWGGGPKPPLKIEFKPVRVIQS